MKSSAPDSTRLLTITGANSDRNVSEMIAAAMLETDRQPYLFSINHDIRPPKCLACPIHYDWAAKGRVGIRTMDRERARKWIASAAMHGYQINRDGGTPLTSSIAIARRRAENLRYVWIKRGGGKMSGNGDDDDIPF